MAHWRRARCPGGRAVAVGPADTPGVREVFGGFTFAEVETTYTVGIGAAGAGKRVVELVVRGCAALGICRLEGQNGVQAAACEGIRRRLVTIIAAQNTIPPTTSTT
jgi:hypothetical protein